MEKRDRIFCSVLRVSEGLAISSVQCRSRFEEAEKSGVGFGAMGSCFFLMGHDCPMISIGATGHCISSHRYSPDTLYPSYPSESVGSSNRGFNVKNGGGFLGSLV